jgi:anaerobic magnesium-protoporphyrin IX monomethyl ester cyclase
MSLDTLLIMPPYRLQPPFKYQMLDPPRSLALLASILRTEGYSVEILDASVTEIDYDQLTEEVVRRQPRTVGICNRSTYGYPTVCKTAKRIKARLPDVPVYVGGTYVSHDPEGALKRTDAIDYLAVGESEYHIVPMMDMMLNDRDPAQVDGIAFLDKNGKYVQTKPFRAADLNDKIMPALDLLPLDLYVKRNERYITELIRGCVHKCPYCTTSLTHGSGIRRRPVEYVIEELQMAKSYGFNYMYFVDDIFTVDRRLVRDLCDAMVEAKLDLLWPCMTTVGAIDRPTLDSMRQAGCDLVAYGVETFAEEALKAVGRAHSLRHIQRAFAMTKEAGIRTLAFMIFGMPKCTFNDEMRTLQALAEIQPDAVRAFSFKPYPGTIYYKEPEKMGIRILSDDYNRYSQLDEATHETEYLSHAEIVEGLTICRYLYRSGGTVSPGVKYRRRKGVQVWKTGEGGLLYNPYTPEEKRKTDSYLNSMRLDPAYFEVMYRFDGYHNAKDITTILMKLFDLSQEEATTKVAEVTQKALDMDLIREVPDIMQGRPTFFRGTEEEIFRQTRVARGEPTFRDDDDAIEDERMPMRAATPV